MFERLVKMRQLWIILLLFLLMPDAQAFVYYSNSLNRHMENIRRPYKISPIYRKRAYLPQQKKISLTKILPNVDSVYIKGHINLRIVSGQTINKISIRRLYQGLSIKTYGRGIYINYTKSINCNRNPIPAIVLYMNELHHLVVAGNSSVIGEHVNTYGLTIDNCANSYIYLSGPVRLIRVIDTGSGVICVNGVTTDHLHILATRNGTLRLSGNTGLLLIRAFQKVTVDTRFMCSDLAMVQAADQSLVTVRTRGSLRAFAGGMSNIYYYTTPGQLLQHSVLSGNVFNMS